MNHPNIGLSTEKDSTFKILGKGTVILKTLINSISTTITLNDVLHTPSLRSNLILVKGAKGDLETATSKSKRGGGSPQIAC